MVNPILFAASTCLSSQPSAFTPLQMPTSTRAEESSAMTQLTMTSQQHSLFKPSAVKKYRCDVCGKAFSRSNTLVTHKVDNSFRIFIFLLMERQQQPALLKIEYNAPSCFQSE